MVIMMMTVMVLASKMVVVMTSMGDSYGVSHIRWC